MESLSSKSQIVEENDCFFFESDHLALKGNKDYSELLKTLFVLQSQRQRLLKVKQASSRRFCFKLLFFFKDYEEVAKLKKQVLEEPLSVVETLKNGESLNVPDAIRIADVKKNKLIEKKSKFFCDFQVPVVNWSKYKVKIPEKFIKEIENQKSEGIEQNKNEDLFRDRSKNTKSKVIKVFICPH